MGGREMKKVRRSRRDGRETQPGCTSPIRLQTSVRVGVCESKSETVTLRGGGAASVPFFSNKPPWGGIWIITTAGMQHVKIKQIFPHFSGFCLALSCSLLWRVFLFDFLLFLSDRNLPAVKLYFYERICEGWRSGSIPSAISSNSEKCVSSTVSVSLCVCVCARAAVISESECV